MRPETLAPAVKHKVKIVFGEVNEAGIWVDDDILREVYRIEIINDANNPSKPSIRIFHYATDEEGNIINRNGQAPREVLAGTIEGALEGVFKI